jgi:hypothetical protein
MSKLTKMQRGSNFGSDFAGIQSRGNNSPVKSFYYRLTIMLALWGPQGSYNKKKKSIRLMKKSYLGVLSGLNLPRFSDKISLLFSLPLFKSCPLFRVRKL